ncbi:MAG TPA: PilN domain-containing protein [Candidatus Saccharimonadales bacterium]|nr:PilN domain-containing protein [Candidatus Saccharimonadales bacterium]
MINLLPPAIKQDYRYAEANLHLIRWVVLFGVALVGLVLLSVGGMMHLQKSTDEFTRQIATQQASLQKQNLAGTQKQVTEMSNNLRLVVQVLSREVLFSKLFTQLGNAMPKNTVLTNLSISQTIGGIDITARATNYQSATQVQVNLADPANKIFSHADIQNITCSSGTDSGSDPLSKTYPCTVTIRALFADNNPFLFINSGKGAKQ